MWLWAEVVRVGGAQEDMVAIALAEEQIWWLHCACVAQNRDRPCKEELVHHLANRDLAKGAHLSSKRTTP